MTFSIFLLLYFKAAFFYVEGCISNPRRTCSPSTYQYSAECRQQYDGSSHLAQSNPYPLPNQYPNQYHGFLGDNVHARTYSERGGTNGFAKSDVEIQCRSALDCSWRNVDDDQMDWVVGEGNVDSTKLSLITGSQTPPEEAFLILASDPRPPFHGGMLVSLPIGCQQSTGILSFRYWRSRARSDGYEPDLDVCTRKALEQTLENCLTVTPTINHTIIASIPPLLEPFEIVIRGYGFENEPEGGLILLDRIDYFAHIDQPQNCVAKLIDETQIEPFSAEVGTDGEQHTISRDTDDSDSTSLISNEVVHRAKKQGTPTEGEVYKTAVTETVNVTNKNENCESLNCYTDGIDVTCAYNRQGNGAAGDGILKGWKTTTLQENIANRLTGIHDSPSFNDESRFLVADFPGFRRYPVSEKFVLESPTYSIVDGPGTYLSFSKYIATQGIELTICEDSFGMNCFWDVYEHSAEPFARRWTTEVVLLPGNLHRFFFIATQDMSVNANNGQVGISKIGVYSDTRATFPYC